MGANDCRVARLLNPSLTRKGGVWFFFPFWEKGVDVDV
jgi:hypothetical protein